MISRQKSANYARALFNIEGSSEQVHSRQEDLEDIAEVIRGFPEILYLLGCPQLSIENKMLALEKILKRNLDPHTKELIGLLLKQRKAVQIRQIAFDYHKLVMLGLKEMDVEIAAVEPLSEQAKGTLKAKLEDKLKKKVNIVEVIDSSLLGGFTILVHNQMLDLSIKGTLTNLKKQLLKAEL